MSPGSKNIVWMASYPKSGNTWFRLVLSHLRTEPIRPLDLKEIDAASIASSRSHFDEMAGISGSDLTHEEVDELRADVYREEAKETDELIFKKVHDAWTLTAKGNEIFPADVTKAVIYIIRNPLDIAVSYAHHSAKESSEMVKIMNQSNHVLCEHPGKLHNQLRQKILSWSEHVISWADRSGLPLTVVRYEDMIEQPYESFKTAFEYIDIFPEENHLRKSIEYADFNRIAALEEEYGFKEKPIKMKSFFRSGTPGEWKNKLPKSEVDAIISHHHTVMQRFGYLE